MSEALKEAPREKFEQWARSQWPNIDLSVCRDCYATFHYSRETAQNLFNAFIAGWEAALSESAGTLKPLSQYVKGSYTFSTQDDRDKAMKMAAEIVNGALNSRYNASELNSEDSTDIVPARVQDQLD